MISLRAVVWRLPIQRGVFETSFTFEYIGFFCNYIYTSTGYDLLNMLTMVKCNHLFSFVVLF